MTARRIAPEAAAGDNNEPLYPGPVKIYAQNCLQAPAE